MASTSMRLALWEARDGVSAAGEMVADEAMRLPAFPAASENIRGSIGSSQNIVDSEWIPTEHVQVLRLRLKEPGRSSASAIWSSSRDRLDSSEPASSRVF